MLKIAKNICNQLNKMTVHKLVSFFIRRSNMFSKFSTILNISIKIFNHCLSSGILGKSLLTEKCFVIVINLVFVMYK